MMKLFDMQRMDERKDVIFRQISQHNGKQVPVASRDHTIALIESMFNNAHEIIRIYTTELSPKVYANSKILEAARSFLFYNAHRLEIITEKLNKDTVQRHPFILSFPPEYNIKIYKVSPGISRNIPYHFALMDNECFRFEGDKMKFASVAACDSEFVKKLVFIFESLKENRDNCRLIWPQN